MKKKIFIMLMFSMFLTGCSEKNVATESNIKVEEDSGILLEYGYEKISDIAYCKIDSTGEKPVCYIEYIQDSPENSFYLMGSFLKQLEYDCDFILTWNGKQYKFNDYLEEDNIEDVFPEEWKEIVENAINGITVNDMVSKNIADEIDKEVQKFCENYKKEAIEENEKEIDESNIIANKEFFIDEEKLLLYLSENEGNLEIGAYGSTKTEEKASLLLTSIKSTFEDLDIDYTIVISYEEFFVTCMKTGDSIFIAGTNKDGTSTSSLPDWIVSEFEMSSEEAGKYTLEVLTAIKEFNNEFLQ